MSCCIAKVGDCLTEVTITRVMPDLIPFLQYVLTGVDGILTEVPGNEFVTVKGLSLLITKPTEGGIVSMPSMNMLFSTVAGSTYSQISRVVNFPTWCWQPLNAFNLFADLSSELQIKVGVDKKFHSFLSFPEGANLANHTITVKLYIKAE